MDKTLYLECYSGISGDMTVAALLDLGVDPAKLQEALESLPLDGFKINISRVKKAGIDACDFDVVLEEDNHDHDMAYLHGDDPHIHEHCHEHHHDHEHDHEHHHEHEHDHDHCHEHHHDHDHDHVHCHEHDHCHEHHHDHDHDHHHHHTHRGLPEIVSIIEGSALSEGAKATAVKIFRIIAEAEAKAHGLPVEEVHFHEVGAVDSIVDIAAVGFCIDYLGVKDVVVPVLYEGTGTVRCQHGILPVPVPAVANIAEAHGIDLHMTGTFGEFVTPTGAAIVAALRTKDTLPPDFRIVKSGIGAGKRNYERPSLLRAMFIEEKKEAKDDCILKLESNIDDCTGEQLGYVMKLLLEAGARDVHYFPVFMKKNRPGYQLNVVCKEEKKDELLKIIFGQTTTIGVRIIRSERAVLPREIRRVATSFGEVRVKTVTLPGGEKRSYPEYDDIEKICLQSGKPFPEVFNAVFSQANN